MTGSAKVTTCQFQGFETSESRDLFLEAVVEGLGFHYHEFLINPTQINIPNSRLRLVVGSI